MTMRCDGFQESSSSKSNNGRSSSCYLSNRPLVRVVSLRFAAAGPPPWRGRCAPARPLKVAAPHAAARRIAASAGLRWVEARANPASVASPEPTAEITGSLGGCAFHTGPFADSIQMRPSLPKVIAALAAPRRIISCPAATTSEMLAIVGPAILPLPDDWFSRSAAWLR